MSKQSKSSMIQRNWKNKMISCKLMTSLIINSRLFVFEAEKSPQNAPLLLTKANAIKCKEYEDVKKLCLKLLEQRKVEVVCNWNCIQIDSHTFYFNYYNRFYGKECHFLHLFYISLHLFNSMFYISILKVQSMYCSHYKVNNTFKS